MPTFTPTNPMTTATIRRPKGSTQSRLTTRFSKTFNTATAVPYASPPRYIGTPITGTRRAQLNAALELLNQLVLLLAQLPPWWPEIARIEDLIETLNNQIVLELEE